MLIQNSLLFDGEKGLGRLPEFKIASTVFDKSLPNMSKIASTVFDMFGKDFIGVSSDRPIYYDKQLLVRVNIV